MPGAVSQSSSGVAGAQFTLNFFLSHCDAAHAAAGSRPECVRDASSRNQTEWNLDKFYIGWIHYCDNSLIVTVLTYNYWSIATVKLADIVTNRLLWHIWHSPKVSGYTLSILYRSSTKRGTDLPPIWMPLCLKVGSKVKAAWRLLLPAEQTNERAPQLPSGTKNRRGRIAAAKSDLFHFRLRRMSRKVLGRKTRRRRCRW